ncbi:MAG: enoyl-CoA hydratase [Gemmatimonadota bacterium]|jgi:2-(1,2-epoxy-1,2-dihydrophenyl)acetyl-CoA isomerase
MPDLLIDSADGVATLTMNRPEARNALSSEMRAGLDDAFHRFERDDSVRCVVLRGAGDHFMAGGDVKGFGSILSEEDPGDIRDLFLHRVHELHTLMFSMRRLPKPIVASVRGAAAGAGVSFAACCDLIIASEDAFFTLAYSHIGTSPDGGSTYALPRAIGNKKAMEMALLGERLDAASMARFGLVNFVVPTDRLEEETASLAKRLATGPTRAYGNAKRLIYGSLENQMERQLQMEAEAFADCASSEDFREGVAAFVEKRQVVFKGR